MAKRVLGKLAAKQIATKSPGRYGDGGGLWLYVRESGSRSWEFRWMLDGKAEAMGLGSYPDVTLAEAREAAHECRKITTRREDPRKRRNVGAVDEPPKPSFQEFSEGWIDRKKASCGKVHIYGCTNKLNLHVYPAKLADGRQFGLLPIDEVDTNAVIAVLSPIWPVKVNTADKIRTLIEQILDAAKALELRKGDNPAHWRGHLATYFPSRRAVRRVKRRPSLPWQQAPDLVAQLRPGRTTDDALLLLVHIVVRVSVVCAAEWPDVDFENHKLLVPEDRVGIKGLELPNGIFEIPLPDPLMRMLRRRYKSRVSKFIFPGQKPGQHIHETTLLRRAKQLTSVEITNHGFRATFRTWADKRTICEKEPKEMIIGHSVGDETELAYARDDWFEKRRLLLEVWSEFLLSGVDRGVDINAMFLERFGGRPLLDAAE